MGRVKFDVKKISIAGILDLTDEAIESLTDKEKRTLASRLSSAANKRIKRAIEKGSVDTTPKFSIKGRVGADLEFEILRAKSYLSSTQRKVPSTIQRIIDTPYKTWVTYDEATLKKEVQTLAKTANSRIRALRKAGLDSPALKKVEDEGGLISVKGKDLNQLRAEFTRAKSFLSSKTSTVSGVKNWKQRSISTVNQVYGLDIGVQNFDLLWETWAMASEYNEKYKIKEYKYKILETINNIIVDYGSTIKLNRDDIMDILIEQNLIEIAYRIAELAGLYLSPIEMKHGLSLLCQYLSFQQKLSPMELCVR